MPIYKTRSGKWKIENVPGTCDTKEECTKRLQAIKASQARRSRMQAEPMTKSSILDLILKKIEKNESLTKRQVNILGEELGLSEVHKMGNGYHPGKTHEQFLKAMKVKLQ